MLADFLKALREGMQREARPTLLGEVTGERVARYAMPDGTVEWIDRPEPLRRWSFASFSDLCAFLVDKAADNPNAMVFHDKGKLTVLLDSDDRREVIAMALDIGSTFGELCHLAGAGRAFKVPELVRFLRKDLGVDAELLAKFRRIDFTRLEQATNQVDRGRESLGRHVEATVQKVEEVPESFAIYAPVYSTPGIREHEMVQATVTVAVHLDLAKQAIELSANFDEIALGFERAHAAIKALLPQSVPAYRGSPG